MKAGGGDDQGGGEGVAAGENQSGNQQFELWSGESHAACFLLRCFLNESGFETVLEFCDQNSVFSLSLFLSVTVWLPVTTCS